MWLRSLEVTDLEKADHIDIIPQPIQRDLLDNDMGSRPDMAITLTGEGNKELIFVESKIGSIQGRDQLQRYTEILADEKRQKAFKKVSLVFITRNYEAAFCR